MSFILEALKKSEQQRQGKNAPQQEVRKRTLSAQDRRQSRWPYWTVAGALPLVLLGSWWLLSEPESSQEQKSVTTQAVVTPVSSEKPERPKPIIEKKLTQQEPALVIEPAPVPRDDSVANVAPIQPAKGEEAAPVVHNEPTEVAQPARVVTGKPVAENIITEQIQPEPIVKPSPKATPVNLPLYLDLSRELRDQMPRLAMSMHYYIADPARRMVRINNLILHEGDWVSDDLQVVEITSTGAILEFFGKLFEMRSGGR